MGNEQLASVAPSYAESGVSLVRAETAADIARKTAGKHRHRGVIEEIGGFAALFDLAAAGWQNPLLVAACDGVGSKLELAQNADTAAAHEAVGRDLVAMCVNDLACRGAAPLFFLDYIAAAVIDAPRQKALLAGVASACAEADCALVGGETAELPGLYAPRGYDLAGFAVGAVERDRLLPRAAEIRAGQPLYALPATGIHANGFSLVRKILRDNNIDFHAAAPFDESRSLINALLEPTPILARDLRRLAAAEVILAAAHITGGGVIGNLPRVLPDDIAAEIETERVPRPAVFSWLQKAGDITEDEMWRVFNCGLAAVVVCADEKRARDLPDSAFRVGTLTARDGDAPRVRIT